MQTDNKTFTARIQGYQENLFWSAAVCGVVASQVCELDIIFNFEKAYFILDEFLLGGEAQETSKKNVLKAIEQADLLQEVHVVLYQQIAEPINLPMIEKVSEMSDNLGGGMHITHFHNPRWCLQMTCFARN